MSMRSGRFYYYLIPMVLAIAVTALLWRMYSPVTLVEDRAGLLSPAQREDLRRYHRYLREDHGIDYRVLTVNEADDINRYANDYYRSQEIGSLSDSGRGLLLVIATSSDQVRLEVSMGLEGIFVDAFVGYLEREQMVPFFRAGRVADGILAATELLVTRVQNADAGHGVEGEAWHAESAGAGATGDARLGAGYRRPGLAGADVLAGETPEQTVLAYIRAMAEHNMRPDLTLYTEETRRMLAEWVTTTAQADNLVKTYRDCRALPARIDPQRQWAVIRYPVAQRQCAPWFLRREQGAWRLDLLTMQQVIRFGRSNAWHFNLEVEHPYRFAFSDWRFDRNGYPYE